MYTLFTDKAENFECNIDIEGASISDTQARLVLESKNINLLFEGSVDANGRCSIVIPKLKDYLKESKEGSMRLEVIAEDTFFSPWEDSFELKASKKVQVEVLSNKEDLIKEGKPSIKVSMPAKKVEKKQAIQEKKAQPKKTTPIVENHGAVLAKLLERKGINLSNIAKNPTKVNVILEKYFKAYDVKVTYDSLLNEILNHLN